MERREDMAGRVDARRNNDCARSVDDDDDDDCSWVEVLDAPVEDDVASPGSPFVWLDPTSTPTAVAAVGTAYKQVRSNSSSSAACASVAATTSQYERSGLSGAGMMSSSAIVLMKLFEAPASASAAEDVDVAPGREVLPNSELAKRDTSLGFSKRLDMMLVVVTDEGRSYTVCLRPEAEVPAAAAAAAAAVVPAAPVLRGELDE